MISEPKGGADPINGNKKAHVCKFNLGKMIGCPGRNNYSKY